MNQGSFEPVFFACGPSWGNDSDEEKVGLSYSVNSYCKGSAYIGLSDETGKSNARKKSARRKSQPQA